MVITVSGPIRTSSVYKKRKSARKADVSTSGNLISSSRDAIPPLNRASKTAEPADKTKKPIKRSFGYFEYYQAYEQVFEQIHYQQ